MNSYNYSSTKSLNRGTQIIWYMLGIIELFLIFRFVLKLLGANPATSFASFIYKATYFFTDPFLSAFGIANASGSVLEWTTVLAMLVYWIIAVGLIKLLIIGRSVRTSEDAIRLNNISKLL